MPNVWMRNQAQKGKGFDSGQRANKQKEVEFELGSV